MILTTIDYILTSALVWILIFLLHELMHIKSQGLFMTGTIWVHKLGMTVCADTIHNSRLHSLGGGILSSIVCFIACFLSQDIQFKYAFFTMGWIQFAYGLYEGYIGVKYRYLIYIGVGILCTMFWFFMY